MKKFLAMMLIAFTVLSLASCGDAYNNAISQLYEEVPSGYIYTAEQIDALMETHDAHGHFKGKVLSVADFSTIGEGGIPLYIYVYKFELEEDAKYWYDNGCIGWTYAVLEDNVVVYGSNKIIYDLEL